MSCSKVFPCFKSSDVPVPPKDTDKSSGCLKVTLFVVLFLAALALIPGGFGGAGLWLKSAPAWMQTVGQGLTIYGVTALSAIGTLSILGLMVYDVYLLCQQKATVISVKKIPFTEVTKGSPVTKIKNFAEECISYGGNLEKNKCAIFFSEVDQLYYVGFRLKEHELSFVNNMVGDDRFPQLDANTEEAARNFCKIYLRDYKLIKF